MSELDVSGHMSIDEIMERMRACWTPNPGAERVDVADALYGVPASDVFSEVDIPVCRGAECDGIAVRSSDFADGAPDVSSWTLGVDYAMADMGSDFDDRFDAVIAIEDVNFSGGGVALSENVRVTPGSLVEPKGGTIYKGELLARKGFRLSSIDIANLVTAGVRRLDILKNPRVAFIPTGKDLVPGGELPARGQAVDCNSAMTRAVLSGFGAEVVLFPIVKDVPGELEGILRGAMESCDIVLIGGGSSKGTGDFCPRLIKVGSQFYSHYVKARPGRPIVTAVNGGKPVINIPGPAFSAFFPLQWCVRGLIEHWFGLNGTPRPKIFVRAKSDLMLGCLPLAYGLFFQVGTEGGEPVASPLDERVRGELFMKANAYAILPIGSPGFRAGDVLELYPID